MMMVVVTVMMAAVMMMTMVLLHRRRVGAGGAQDRHREHQSQSQPKRGEEGLFHDFVSFFAGVPGDQIGDPSLAIGTILLVFFDNFSQL